MASADLSFCTMASHDALGCWLGCLLASALTAACAPASPTPSEPTAPAASSTATPASAEPTSEPTSAPTANASATAKPAETAVPIAAADPGPLPKGLKILVIGDCGADTGQLGLGPDVNAVTNFTPVQHDDFSDVIQVVAAGMSTLLLNHAGTVSAAVIFIHKRQVDLYFYCSRIVFCSLRKTLVISVGPNWVFERTFDIEFSDSGRPFVELEWWVS